MDTCALDPAYGLTPISLIATSTISVLRNGWFIVRSFVRIAPIFDPHQMQKWSDCKAMYRLMDNDKVSFQAIIEPHCTRTRSLAQEGVFLSICDTTEISFSFKRKIASLGKTGDNSGQGSFSTVPYSSRNDRRNPAWPLRIFRIASPNKEKPELNAETRSQLRRLGRVEEAFGNLIPTLVSSTYAIEARITTSSLPIVTTAKRMGSTMQHLERKNHPADTTTSEEPGKDAQTIHLIEYLKAQPVVGTYELKVAANPKA